MEELTARNAAQFSNVVYWDSTNPLPNQFNDLKLALSSVKPAVITNFQELEARIMVKAKEIWESKKKIKFVTRTEDGEITELIDVKKKEPKNIVDSFEFKMKENSSGWGITLKVWKHFQTATQTEAELIIPNYPLHSEDRKITQIVVTFPDINCSGFRHEPYGEGEETGKVIFHMDYQKSQFGNSSLTAKIKYCYSYNMVSLDKEVIKKKYPKEVIDQVFDYDQPDYTYYLGVAKDVIIVEEKKNSNKRKILKNNMLLNYKSTIYFLRKIYEYS